MIIATHGPIPIIRRAAVILALSSAIGARAQTYYYLDQIVVTPGSPTTADDINITVNGSLSNTASFIANVSHSLIGNTVEITVNAANSGIGLEVLVPDTESMVIGTLPAGTYSIVVSGSFTADLAPAQEHQFTVSGGGEPTDCDSLSFLGARWGVLNADQIVITVANASSDLFDYPGFVLLTTGGDTLAKESVNYFGIGSGPQDHILNVQPGAILDDNAVSGDLHLWSGSFTEFECEWPVDWQLCLTEACYTVTPYLWNLGNAIVVADVPYTLTNEDGQEVSSGVFSLTTVNQNAYGQEVCLPAGHYTLRPEQIGVVGGQLYFGMVKPPMNFEMVQFPYVQGTSQNEAAIQIMERCIDGSNGSLEVTRGAGLVTASTGEGLLLTSSDRTSIGRVELMDALGRRIASTISMQDRIELQLNGLASGTYIIRTEHHGAVRFAR